MPDKTSQSSMEEATRSRLSFSGHRSALGAAGQREVSFDPQNCEYLRTPGQSIAISPEAENFESLMVGVAWDNLSPEKAGFLKKLLQKKSKIGVDLDIGCLYELQDGSRGAIQAFGKKFGNFENAPYISLSGDERTGDADGHDEYILVNGRHWNDIKRIVFYLYIYGGVTNWKQINPQVIIDVPGEDDLVVTLDVHDDTLDLCAVGGLENVRGGIKLTNFTEYFPGHEEMDRAFGFGLEWGDGTEQKN